MIGGIFQAIQAVFCRPEPIDWEAKRRADDQRIRRANAERQAENEALEAFCGGVQWTPEEMERFRARYDLDSIEPRMHLSEPIQRRSDI